MTFSTSNPRAKQRWGILIMVVIAISALTAGLALAVHDLGVFQLDGNARTADQSDPTANDDWDRVCHQVTITDDTDGVIPNQCASASDTTGATAVAFASELNRSASIYTGGGSKDPEDISAWAWKDGGGLPDKDNLLHAFAARYSTADAELLYFGSDRYANDGDAQQGFWFLQNEVTLDGAKVGGGTGFTGVHKEGDLLLISDFSNGGDVSTIKAYKWVDSGGDTSTHLDFLGDLSNECSPALTDDGACGIVSPTGLTPSPWSFNDKSGNVNNFANGEFFEAGVNLTPLDLAGECFATLVSETRSSTSPTATLKDFVLASFGRCTSDISSAQKWTPNDSATITVGGRATWTGSVTFSLFANATCTGTPVYGPTTAQNVSESTPTVSTSNTTYHVTAAGPTTLYWKVDFDGTAPIPDASTCNEASTLSIDNDTTAP